MALLFAGLKTSKTQKTERLPVFGYVFDDTKGPRECSMYEERVDFSPLVLFEDVMDDVQVSMSYHFLDSTHVPIGEIANILKGISTVVGGPSALLTTLSLERLGKNTESALSQRFSSSAYREFSEELRIGPNRENKTEFVVPLVYKEGNEPEKKAGRVVFSLIPKATLSNAPVDPQTGAPKFGNFPFDQFPDVPGASQGDRSLKNAVSEFKQDLEFELKTRNPTHLVSAIDKRCGKFTEELLKFRLNKYDRGYVLWSALTHGLPDHFNKDANYAALKCTQTDAKEIRAAGLPIKTRDQLVAEAKALADKATQAAEQVAAAAKLAEQQMATTPEIQQMVREVYTEAATAAHAAERAQNAAALGILPSARTAASEASRVRSTLIERIARDPRSVINTIARDTRLRPEG